MIAAEYNFSVDESEKISILRSVHSWRTASALLQKERWDRLRAMTDQECREAVVALLSFPYPDLPERGSGLVEQQKVFRRVR